MEPNTNTEKIKALFSIEITKEVFKKEYSLRARIGIYIGVLLGLVDLKITKE